jgi:hypothetical protein
MEEEKEITKNCIKEAAEYLFKIIKEPQERRIKIKRGCDTYGLQDWGTHCQNENCEPCNRHMKEFDKLCQEIIQEQLEELKNTEIITLIDLKRVLATFDEYDSDGYPVEVWLPSGENLTSPLSHVTQNAQKTVFLDHLANEKL